MPLHLRRHFFAAFAVNCCSAALFTQLLICIFVSNSHATRARHRQSASVIFQPTFQLTRPTRGATSTRRSFSRATAEFQLTRPTRGATIREKHCAVIIAISTHTPRILFAGRILNFNSHAPRGARHPYGGSGGECQDFNSHAPRGARPAQLIPLNVRLNFNSHAPRGARPAACF